MQNIRLISVRVWILAILLVGLLGSYSQAITEQEIAKSPKDQRQYKGLVLDNGLKVILVSDPKVEKAAVALSVAAGHYNNPADREGLAHFLEHMLFLGTQKYPQAAEYKEYITAHGGYDNAWTSDRITQYHFTILPDHLTDGMDRFAQFFIAPLFNQEFVDRERHAVNSEFELNKQKDTWRANMVDRVTTNPAHPRVLFNVGDLQTLDDSKQKAPLREQLLKFYRDYYSADRMSLAVVAPQSIAELQKMVVTYFSEIPKHQTLNNEIDILAYTDKQTAKQISVQTIGDHQELSINFPIPSQLKNYNYRAIDYILYLIGRSGSGGLVQTLKDKGWISEGAAYTNDMSYRQDIASISFTLTKEGLARQDQVIQYTFAYIKFLRDQGPQKSIFNDLKIAGQRNYIYADNDQPLEYAGNLSYAMQYYALPKILTSSMFTTGTEYSPDLIQELWQYFTPRNARIFILNKDVQGDKLESKYNTKYKVQDLSDTQLAELDSYPNDAKFALPVENKFMPQDFSLRPKVSDVHPHGFPLQILHKPGISLWHKQDEIFALPKLNIKILMQAPDMQNTARRAVLSKLMERVIGDRLIESSDQYSLAGVGVDVSLNTQGLELSIAMFSDKTVDVIDSALDNIRNQSIEDKKFAIYKDELKRDWMNFKHELPVRQGLQYLSKILFDPAWLPEDLLKELPGITKQDLQEYLAEFSQNLQLKALFHGNISDRDSISLIEYIAQQMKVNTSRKTNEILPKFIKIADGSNFNYAFKVEHTDSALASYYQALAADDISIATALLMVDLVDSPLFDDLRTQQQLGYVVGLQMQRYREQPGIMVYIEAVKHKPAYLQARMQNFFKTFRSKLALMSENELATYKKSLADNLVIKPNSLSEETMRYWAKIIDGTYRFNFNYEIAQQVNNLSLAQILAYYDSLWLNPKTSRVISTRTQDKKGPLVGSKPIANIDKFKHNSLYE